MIDFCYCSLTLFVSLSLILSLDLSLFLSLSLGTQLCLTECRICLSSSQVPSNGASSPQKILCESEEVSIDIKWSGENAWSWRTCFFFSIFDGSESFWCLVSSSRAAQWVIEGLILPFLFRCVRWLSFKVNTSQFLAAVSVYVLSLRPVTARDCWGRGLRRTWKERRNGPLQSLCPTSHPTAPQC